MTNRLLISIQTGLFLAVAALLMLSASLAHASEVTGTLSSGIATGSTATGTITGGTGNTISGTVVSPDGGVGGGGDDSSGGSSRRHSGGSSNNNNNNDGEVLGAETEPTYGVGGGGGYPGIPNTGAGDPVATLAVLLGALAVLGAGALALRRYRY